MPPQSLPQRWFWSPHLGTHVLTTQTMDGKSFAKGLKENTGSMPFNGWNVPHNPVVPKLQQEMLLGHGTAYKVKAITEVLAKWDPNVLEAYKMS